MSSGRPSCYRIRVREATSELARRLPADPMNTWLAAVRPDLAEQWKREGCAAFDQANTPLEVAEAATQLRCALELSQLLDSQRSPKRERISATLRENVRTNNRRHARPATGPEYPCKTSPSFRCSDRWRWCLRACAIWSMFA